MQLWDGAKAGRVDEVKCLLREGAAAELPLPLLSKLAHVGGGVIVLFGSGGMHATPPTCMPDVHGWQLKAKGKKKRTVKTRAATAVASNTLSRGRWPRVRRRTPLSETTPVT